MPENQNTNPADLSKVSPAGDVTAAQVERINVLQKRLAALQAQLNRGANLTGIVGGILLVLLFGYFMFGYSMITDAAKPEKAVPAVFQAVDDRLPEYRATLEQKIIEAAPDLAASLSQQAVDAIPKLRERVEDVIIERFDEVIADTVKMTQTEFRTILKENRPALEKGFDRLAANEKMSEQELKELEDILEKELQADLQEQSAIVLETLRMLTEKAEHLRNGKNLDPVERKERLILMVARRMQLEAADEGFKTRKWVPTLVKSAGTAEPDEKPASNGETESDSATEKKSEPADEPKSEDKADTPKPKPEADKKPELKNDPVDAKKPETDADSGNDTKSESKTESGQESKNTKE